MRKIRLNKSRILAALLSLCMIISLFNGIDLPHFFQNETIAQAEDGGVTDSNEYADETLEHMWDSDGDGDPNDDAADKDYWNAARPYYSYAGSDSYSNTFGSQGGVEYKTVFHVYAFEGDTICIGSSVNNSMLNIDHVVTNRSENNKYISGENAAGYGNTYHFPDEGSVDVVMTDPYGNKIPIDITEGKGYIASPGNEYAAIKMQSQDDGTFKGSCTIGSVNYDYTPYTYPVQETGVYTFEFHSYDKTGHSSPNSNKRRSDQWPTDEHNYVERTGSEGNYTYQDGGGLIAAINLTVFDEKGDKQTGRTYADFLSLQMDNVNQGVRDTYYVLTTDSYIYKMQFNGVSPYTYNFFANNKGIYDINSNAIIYTSVKDYKNESSFARMGAAFKYPGTKDTDLLKSYYIFLEYPDDQLEGILYEKAVQPDPAKNIRFVGEIEQDGKQVPGAYVGVGGYFAFDVEEATTATLRLEFTGDSFKGKGYAPVEISGAVTPHSTNYFYWDGKDGNGKVIEADTYDINDFAFTVTAKAGEIHFPIIDMENAGGGITFTRLSHIYDKDGERLDYDDNIYGLTKNVIYYDETAIYYGEQAASTGISEDQVTLALDQTKSPWSTYRDVNDAIIKYFEENPGKYWTYNNMRSGGGEYEARIESNYLGETSTTVGTNTSVRVGDHSHTTNVINYFNTSGDLITKDEITADQQNMINYLNSQAHPVGKSANTSIYYINYQKEDKANNIKTSQTAPEVKDGSDKGYSPENVEAAQSTTDYAIANYWTFIPAKPAKTESTIPSITIADREGDFFNLTGRVFFDSEVNDDKVKVGRYDDMSTAGEYLMSDVETVLYTKTTDISYREGKTYVKYNSTEKSIETVNAGNFGSGENVYEYVASEKTMGDGMCRYMGLPYDKDTGTEYLYVVTKPNPSYTLTSGSTSATPLGASPNYYGYYADKSYDSNGKGTEVQHIKVGGTGGVDPTKYGYSTSTKKPEGNVDVCAVDVGYKYQLMDKSLVVQKKWGGSVENNGKTDSVVFEISYNTATASHKYDYWTVSPGNSWKHQDDYLPAKQNNDTVENYYVSAEYYIDNTAKRLYKHEFEYSGGDYKSFVGKSYYVDLATLYTGHESDIPADGIYTVTTLPDLNGDGNRNGKDIGSIDSWTQIDESKAPYRAVLDRNFASSSTDITVTNAKSYGTIEIFKYHDTMEEGNALQGATFRVYEGTIAEVKPKIEAGTAEWVASGTTRSNGRIAFPDLNPEKTYTVYERYAPNGYRKLEEYYEVKGKNEAIGSGEVKFSDEDYALLNIGNAIADTTFMIRKEIRGRAWQSDDSFTFNIVPQFAGYTAAGKGFTIAENESAVFSTGGSYKTDEDIAKDVSDFAQEINQKLKDNPLVISYTNSFYSYSSNRGDSEYHITSSTEKVSDSLIIPGDDKTRAAFYNIEFPYAGTYTFIITEKEDTDNNTLDYSKREYTVVINVVRELKDGQTGNMTSENSYLTAAVDKITYKDGTTGEEQVFAGNSPVFTNVYHPAPAVQSTTYAIQKELSGREWVNTDDVKDNFTINVKAVNAATADAIKASQLTISGFNGNDRVSLNSEENGWVCTFTEDSHANIPFTAFVFDDIEFPVKFVNNTNNAVEEPDPEWEPDSDEMKKFLDTHTAQTEPVEYWLDISEVVPTDAVGNKYKGITYDTQHYYLHITLRNAEKTVSGDNTEEGEEEDGIIDEIDMELYHADATNDVSSLKGAVATCHTKAEVLDKDAWTTNVTSSDGTYTWFYIDSSGKLIEAKNHSSAPADAKILVRRYEEHTGSHTMTIKNTYAASYVWNPQVQKVLDGRTWRTDDKFTFTLTPDDLSSDGHDMTAEKSVTIEYSSEPAATYTNAFDPITFTQPGTYKFSITETDINGTELATYPITIVLEDNKDGTLTATIDDESIADYVIKFVNEYEGTSFDLSISKTIIGREWKDGEEFTFKIEPDEKTLEAINNGDITLPTDTITPDTSDDYYTATISGGTGTDTLKKLLGEIKINNTKSLISGEELNYKFTISEVTGDLENMYCRVPSYDLYIKVTPKTEPTSSGEYGSENTLSAEYACVVTGATEPVDTSYTTTEGGVTIAFENVATGTLTVEKEVVSSNEDTTEFSFTVEFTFDKDSTNEFTFAEIGKITADLGGGNVEPIVSDGGYTYTYTFKLKHGDSITFSNILPNTTYTITEGTEPANYMFLRITDKNGDVYKGSTEQTAEGTINVDDPPDKYKFISGRIHNLPSAGGTGTQLILLGGLALIIAAALFYTLFYKNDKRRAAR